MSFNLRHVLCFSLLFSCAACATSGLSADGQADLDGDVPPVSLPLGESLLVRADLRVLPGEYLRPALGAAGEVGVILIEGLRGATLDLRGVVLRGAAQDSEPDAGAGRGLVLRDCEGITVLGGRFSGYRVAISIEGCDDVRLDGAWVEPTYGNRLLGSDALPQPDDRLQVETQAGQCWTLDYGAAIAVVDSSRVDVQNCRARGGQNGLVALRSEGCRFLANDFSYLSGWGIALSHCDENLIAGNRCDVVTRRGSPGRSEPDHGATGILLTGGSSDNTIAANSSRRSSAGGRELFSEDNSGQRNRWYANDFSEAAGVAMEIVGATETWFVGNRVRGGQGAGLRIEGSQRLAIVDNEIEGLLGAGIVLEGGRHSVVSGNLLADCDSALEVHPGGSAPGESRDLHVSRNRFEGNILDLVLDRASGLEFASNEFEPGAPPAHLDGLEAEGQPELAAREVWRILADAQGHLPSGRGEHSSLRRASGNPPLVLRRCADWQPPAPFAELPLDPAQRFPYTEEPTLMGPFGPWDPAGEAPRPTQSGGRGLLAGARWQATWFDWDAASDPRGELERWRARRFDPLRRGEIEAWSDPWGGDPEIRASLPETNFGLIASTVIDVSHSGTYVVGEISDDGVRLSIDDEVVLEDWTWHPARQRGGQVELSAGSHRLTLEYFQVDGPAVLGLELAEFSGP
jgi:hypothetical protein